MSIRRGSKWRLTGCLVGLAALAASGTPLLQGQGTEVPERGLQVTGSYRLGEIETVNTKNGNVLLSVPLASLPPGRAGNPGFDLTLNYNSKLWDLFARREPIVGATGNEPRFRTYKELERSFADPGWSYSHQYHVIVEERYRHFRFESPNFPCSPAAGTREQLEASKHWYNHKLWMVFPDGSVRVFRPAGENDPHGDNYFQILPQRLEEDGLQRGLPSAEPARVGAARPRYHRHLLQRGRDLPAAGLRGGRRGGTASGRPRL